MAFALVSRGKQSISTPAKPAHKNQLACQPSLARLQPGPASIRSGAPATALATTPVLQAKLKVGAPNDTFEREADRVADAVMHMPDRAMADAAAPWDGASDLGNQTNRTAPSLQRLCTECATEEERLQRTPIPNAAPLPRISTLQGPLAAQFRFPNQVARMQRQAMEDEEEVVQMQPLEGTIQRQTAEDDEAFLQTKTPANTSPDIPPGIEARLQAIRGGGQPLAAAERAFFEPRFGHDFSHVRVHTDTKAALMARAVNARAFTVGHDIVFGTGQPTPGTPEGRRSLAHELTHVVQQHGRELPPVQPKARGW